MKLSLKKKAFTKVACFKKQEMQFTEEEDVMMRGFKAIHHVYASMSFYGK